MTQWLVCLRGWPIFGVAFMLLVCGQRTWAQSGEAAKWKEYKAQAVARWQRMFGKQLDFEDTDRFNAVYYVNPQPLSSLRSVGNLRFSPYVLESSDLWISRFIKAPVRPPNVKRHPPKKCYLATGFDSSLLFHEWSAKGCAFQMYESGNGVLIRVRPPGFRPGATLGKKELGGWVADILAFDYGSDGAAAEALHLPERIRVGQFFGNRVGRFDVAVTRDWKDYVLGFLSEDSICLLCYKAVHRKELVFFLDRYWLNRGLFQADGVTLVAPPPDR